MNIKNQIGGMFLTLLPALESPIIRWQLFKSLVCHVCVFFTLFVTVPFAGFLSMNTTNQCDLNMYIP